MYSHIEKRILKNAEERSEDVRNYFTGYPRNFRARHEYPRREEKQRNMNSEKGKAKEGSILPKFADGKQFYRVIVRSPTAALPREPFDKALRFPQGRDVYYKFTRAPTQGARKCFLSFCTGRLLFAIFFSLLSLAR